MKKIIETKNKKIYDIFNICDENGITDVLAITHEIIEEVFDDNFYAVIDLNRDEVFKKININIKLPDQYNSNKISLNTFVYMPNIKSIVQTIICWIYSVSKVKLSNYEFFSSDCYNILKTEVFKLIKNLDKLSKQTFILEHDHDHIDVDLENVEDINKLKKEIENLIKAHVEIKEKLKKTGEDTEKINSELASLKGIFNEMMEQFHSNNISKAKEEGSKLVKLFKKFYSPLVTVSTGLTIAYLEHKFNI